MQISSRSFLAIAFLALVPVVQSVSLADEMASFATGGYAAGLRTMEIMHMIDTNKDGKVSKDEWIAFQARVFTSLDKDKSGLLETGEFYGTPSDDVAFATAAFSRGLRTKEMFTKVDANGDGKVSRNEFMNYQIMIFETMDKGKKQELSVTDFIVPAH